MNPIIIILIVPIFFIVLWGFVSLVLSITSGWISLSNNYAIEDKYTGIYENGHSATIGIVNYKYCIKIGLQENKLFLDVMAIFKIGHKALLIPLEDITAKEKEIIFYRFVELSVKDKPLIKIRLSKNALEILENDNSIGWKYKRKE